MKKIAVLGSTGSIGTQTLDVVRSHKDEFEVCAICAGKNALLALEQAKERAFSDLAFSARSSSRQRVSIFPLKSSRIFLWLSSNSLSNLARIVWRIQIESFRSRLT